MTRPLYDIPSFCICSIYVIKNHINHINHINNKVYVGQTWRSMERRFQVHLQNSTANHCIKLRRALEKYGSENFSIELLTICHSQEMSNYWETYFIHKFDSIKQGYNILENGFSRKGIKHTAKTKEKISSTIRGDNNPNAVLERWQVNQIRKEYLDFKNPKTGSKYGALTFLSKKYNVVVSCIFDIVKGNHWT